MEHLVTTPRTSSIQGSFVQHVGDAAHLLLSPFKAVTRLLFSPFMMRTYRVSYMSQEGVSMTRTTERFNAYHDREAYRMAAAIALKSDFTLEEVRKIRTR